LDRFQGPLDLLLHLIRHQDIDIFDIPIATITDQFLSAVGEIDVQDLDDAGEFLEMAATLIRIKAQMLLPRPEDDEEEDPRAELVRRLLEYEQIREIATRLSLAEAQQARRFGKGYVEPRPRRSVEETPLETTWEEVMEAATAVELPHRRDTSHRVRTGVVAVEEKIQLILDVLRGAARVEFRELVSPWKDRMHGVMTFLAGLELSRQRAVSLRQARLFSELWILRRDLEAWMGAVGEEVEERSGLDGGVEEEGGRAEEYAGMVEDEVQAEDGTMAEKERKSKDGTVVEDETVPEEEAVEEERTEVDPSRREGA
jgi:segregation and condensation protein A